MAIMPNNRIIIVLWRNETKDSFVDLSATLLHRLQPIQLLVHVLLHPITIYSRCILFLLCHFHFFVWFIFCCSHHKLLPHINIQPNSGMKCDAKPRPNCHHFDGLWILNRIDLYSHTFNS